MRPFRGGCGVISPESGRAVGTFSVGSGSWLGSAWLTPSSKPSRAKPSPCAPQGHPQTPTTTPLRPRGHGVAVVRSSHLASRSSGRVTLLRVRGSPAPETPRPCGWGVPLRRVGGVLAVTVCGMTATRLSREVTFAIMVARDKNALFNPDGMNGAVLSLAL